MSNPYTKDSVFYHKYEALNLLKGLNFDEHPTASVPSNNLAYGIEAITHAIIYHADRTRK